jgi:plastocyanin
VGVWIGSASHGFGATAGVNVDDDSFSPPSSTINAGDSVTWTWVGFDGHNVTSETKPTAAWKASATSEPPFSFTVNFPNTGTFPYECTIHVLSGMVGTIKVNAATANPPTVSITAPTNNATFTAPATIDIAATAAVAGSTLSGVQFLIDSTSLADVTATPYQTAANSVAAGSHTITAIATAANGLKATNTVSVQVNAAQNPPPIISIDSTNLFASPGAFAFNYSADINSSYVVERSTDLINWNAISTNEAFANPESFTDTNAPVGGAYYKVELDTP